MAKLLSRKYVLAAAGAALVCGLLHVLPFLGGSPQVPVILSAARGLAKAQGLAGYSPASLADRCSAWLWQLGGEKGLQIAQCVAAFLPWVLFAFGLLLAARVLGRFTASAKIRTFLIVVAAAGLVFSCWTPLWEKYYRRDENGGQLVLTIPTELAEPAKELPGGTVFANASTLPYLLLLAPGATGSLDPREAAELTAYPSKWREALRKSQWTAVALSGALSEIRPLLDHLLASPDWRLTRVTNQGYFFLREEGPPIPSLSLQRFHLSTPRDTAVYLAQIAERYDALRRTEDAHSCMVEALKLAPNDADVLAHAASLESSHQHWQDAIDDCDKALRANPLPSNTYPRLLKAVALLKTGQTERAETEARQVLNTSPDDPYTLFLYAQISRSLHDYAAEADTLEEIVRQDHAAGVTVPGGYYVYLGQAYARQGRTGEALAAYRTALQSPELDEKFAAEIRDAMAAIEAKKP